MGNEGLPVPATSPPSVSRTAAPAGPRGQSPLCFLSNHHDKAGGRARRRRAGAGKPDCPEARAWSYNITKMWHLCQWFPRPASSLQQWLGVGGGGRRQEGGRKRMHWTGAGWGKVKWEAWKVGWSRNTLKTSWDWDGWRWLENKNKKVKMYTGSPNVSCFSNKSPVTSKKSELCYTRPWAQPQNLHIWLVLREQSRAQDVAELPQRSAARGCSEAGCCLGDREAEGPRGWEDPFRGCTWMGCAMLIWIPKSGQEHVGAPGSRKSKNPRPPSLPHPARPQQAPPASLPSLTPPQAGLGRSCGWREGDRSEPACICPQALFLLGCYPSG